MPVIAPWTLLFVAQNLQAPPPSVPEVVDLSGAWRFATDADNRGIEAGFNKIAFDDAKWPEVVAGQPFESQGYANVDGFVWYRKTFQFQGSPAGDAIAELGTIDDVDEVYVNGVRIGGMGAFPPAARTAWSKSRFYPFSAKLLKKGANTIAVRLFDMGGDGGLRGDSPRLIAGEDIAEYVAMRTRPATGYATANFAFAMELATDGEFPAHIQTNPTVAGAWLTEVALGSLAFREGDTEVRAPKALLQKPSRLWPFASARYRSPQIADITVDLESFCPVARAAEPYWPAMPLGFAQFVIHNNSDRARSLDIAFRFALDGDCRNVVADEHPEGVFCGLDTDRFSIRSDGLTARFSNGFLKEWSVRAEVPARGHSIVKICFAHTPRTRTGSLDAGPWPAGPELATAGLVHFNEARQHTLSIDQWIPRTGDAALDEALRIYCSAAVQLTKVSTSGAVAAMGYAEMTQRDAYWGTFLHNILFPDLEKRMIEEAFLEQDANGKVPTSILPTTDRGTDVDTNAYAMLRAFRYAKFHADAPFLSKIAANLKGAAVWLASRDTDGDGLPDSTSRWYDWKDAPGLADRKVSAGTSFLYLAAMSELSRAIGTAANGVVLQKEVSDRIELARKTIHASVAQGGLWNGRSYGDRWRAPAESRPGQRNIINHNSDSIGEDQIFGVLFDQVPPERISLLFDSLQAHRRAWGVRESYPYHPASFGREPGDDSNGAVWPWLNYADAWARLKAGRTSEALAILRDVARFDLIDSGEASPHECLHGESGTPMRNSPQLWNASFFGALYHGLFGVERDYNGLLSIAPRVLAARGWRVRVPLREGEVEVADGDANNPPVLRWIVREELPIRVQLPGRPVFETVLAPGQGEKSL